MLKIAPVRATLTRDIQSDNSGAMSPYCIITLKDTKYITSIDYYAGDEPEWKNEIMVNIDSLQPDENIQVNIFNNDDFKIHTLMGTCEIKIDSVLHTAEK